MDPGAFLRGLPPFDGLPEEVFRQAERHLEVSFVEPGSVVLRRGGAPAAFLYVVRKGSVRLEVDGRTVELVEAGDPFGFPSLIGRDSPAFDVVADEECLLLRLPDKVFRQLMEQPAFAAFFVQGLDQRLRQTTEADVPLLAADLGTNARRLIERPPRFVGPEATVAEAARVMSEAGISSVLVDTQPPGILTDRDLRTRILARGLPPSTPVRRAMTRPVATLDAGATLFEVLLLMLERRVHHVPLLERGEMVGVLTDTDLLRHHLKSPFHLLKEVEKAEDPGAVPEYAGRLAGMVESMAFGGLDVSQIGRVVATVNDTLVARALRRAEDELGPPPCAYAWIVFGSEGRREQALLTDQDNALVYERDDDGSEGYFGELAEKVVRTLERCGFPRCPGGFMATSWRMPLAAWESRFESWIAEPEPEALLAAANLFDFRRVHGGLSLQSLEDRRREAGDNRVFLAQLTRAALRFRPPLGLFRTVREEPEGVDLKKGGLLPIVSMGRVHGLEAATPARATLNRLSAAADAGVLSREGADTLAEAFRFLFRLRLMRQLERRRHGDVPGNRVRTEDLSRLEQRHLKDSFQLVRTMQETMAQRFRVDTLG